MFQVNYWTIEGQKLQPWTLGQLRAYIEAQEQQQQQQAEAGSGSGGDAAGAAGAGGRGGGGGEGGGAFGRMWAHAKASIGMAFAAGSPYMRNASVGLSALNGVGGWRRAGRPCPGCAASVSFCSPCRSLLLLNVCAQRPGWVGGRAAAEAERGGGEGCAQRASLSAGSCCPVFCICPWWLQQMPLPLNCHTATRRQMGPSAAQLQAGPHACLHVARLR